MPLAWRVAGDTDFCAVSTVSMCVSWFSSSAFEDVWALLINVPVFTYSLSSRSTDQTLSVIVWQLLVFRSVLPVTFMNAGSVITMYCRMRDHRLQPRCSWGIVSTRPLRRRVWMGSVGRPETSVRNYQRTLGVVICKGRCSARTGGYEEKSRKLEF